MTMREDLRNAAALLARLYHREFLNTPADQRVMRAMLRREAYHIIWRAKDVYPNLRGYNG